MQTDNSKVDGIISSKMQKKYTKEYAFPLAAR